ncbi:MAG: hypothetical protein M3R02_05420 [Chloroflexota bacterium]|nr:hypothetical protein [Chloroflexota bacterium]
MLVVNDGLDALFLGSFLFGLLFSAMSLLLGGIHVGHPHVPSTRLHLGGGHHDGDVGPLNSATILAFIAWFGGVGYLVRNGLGTYALVSVLLGVVGGVIGASALGWFLLKVMLPAERVLDPSDFRLPGTLARVTSSIRADGIGEIVYEQAGVRQVSAARSLDGLPLPRGTEVVILRCERGIAAVQP